MKFLLSALVLAVVTAPVIGVEAEEPTSVGWQRVHGTIETVEGSTMRVRDDGDRAGQVVRVQIDTLPGDVRQNLKVGDKVSVLGSSEPGRIVARYLDHDTSPAALPREALPISP